jgi:putative cardiolipin synthase
MRWMVYIALSSLLLGCRTINPSITRPESSGLASAETTSLGRLYAEVQAKHLGQSGFRLLEYGPEALMARAAMVDRAERTLDLQYYIYDPGKVGHALTQRLLEAADRGVRVRLLLDDNNQGDDRPLIVLASHPNIEVRVFNPFRYRARWMRIPQYLVDLNRINRRMHNKIIVADNQLAILGGRNIGDSYFDISEEGNVRDFDVLIAGPLVRQASAAFDEFWNSPWALPAQALSSEPVAPDELAALRRSLQAWVFGVPGNREKYEALRDEYTHEVLENPGHLVWAKGELIWDAPDKMTQTSPATTRVARRIEQEFDACQQELLIESGYFIPGQEGLKQLEALTQQGVQVKVLTSALEATDQPLVYSAYRRYRRSLLQAGVEIHEYKMQTRVPPGTKRWFAPRSALSSLHAKVMVFDRRRVWIGSFNLDARSVWYNTEIAALIDSPELAAQLERHVLADFTAERSWHVVLPPPPPGAADTRERLKWVGERHGVAMELDREPARNWWQRFRADFYSLFPGVEKLL